LYARDQPVYDNRYTLVVVAVARQRRRVPVVVVDPQGSVDRIKRKDRKHEDADTDGVGGIVNARENIG
jgi:hypothetical protein